MTYGCYNIASVHYKDISLVIKQKLSPYLMPQSMKPRTIIYVLPTVSFHVIVNEKVPKLENGWLHSIFLNSNTRIRFYPYKLKPFNFASIFFNFFLPFYFAPSLAYVNVFVTAAELNSILLFTYRSLLCKHLNKCIFSICYRFFFSV